MRYSYQLEPESVLAEIAEIRSHLEGLNSRLNEVDDKRVIEQLIYEMIADERRYGYLLEMAKELGVHNHRIVVH